MNNTALHPSKLMDEELVRLQALMARLWDDVEARLSAVVETLESTKDPLPGFDKGVIVKERQEIERQALRLFALRQPVADDLRLVMASLLAAVELENVADLAWFALKRLNACALLDEIEVRAPLTRLAGLVLASLRDLRPALGQRDAVLASRIIMRDREVNELHGLLAAQLGRRMARSPETAEECSRLLLACKSLERAGDHVKHVAASIRALEERPAARAERNLVVA